MFSGSLGAVGVLCRPHTPAGKILANRGHLRLGRSDIASLLRSWCKAKTAVTPGRGNRTHKSANNDADGEHARAASLDSPDGQRPRRA